MTQLTLGEANALCIGALAAAEERGYAPLCVAVVDAGGHLLALQRHERAGTGRPAIAIAKASSCLSMGFGGRELERRAQLLPDFFVALSSVLPHGMVALPGGALLKRADGTVVGAVGVSGDTSEHDENCILAGIPAAGLFADVGS